MANRNKRRKRKKNRTNNQPPIYRATALKRKRGLPPWSTTLGCVSGVVSCFHPILGAIMTGGVFIVALWEHNR